MVSVQVEFNSKFQRADDTFGSGGTVLMVTPPLDKAYWLFRVPLYEEQAIVGFPKFGTIGIGFAQEEDWNTNLPYTCGAAEIYEHIKHNKSSRHISKKRCIAAIEAIQAAATSYQISEPATR